MSAELLARVAAKFDASHDFSFADSAVMVCYVGSQSHGTTIERTDPLGYDDVDLMAVVIPPPRYVLGLHDFDNWVAQWEELDVVVYSFHKFVGLLAKQNPNVLGTMWLREEDYLVRRPEWAALVAQRHLFATRAAHASFAGYANGQLQRMTSYSPEIQREIDDLTAKLEACGWHLQDVMDNRSVPMPYGGTTAEEANAMAARLRHLRAKYHQAYMGEKRRNLVVKHGYDTKNAAHLIRLLRMCVEFLADGEMRVYRTHDAEELKAIKRGEWSLEDVKALAEKLFEDARIARDASPLPYGPDHRAISDLVADIATSTLLRGVS
jgi:predicted nucleotidyltransferase